MEVNNKTVPVTGQQDQNTISLDLMNRMKLHGMAEAFRVEQRELKAGGQPAGEKKTIRVSGSDHQISCIIFLFLLPNHFTFAMHQVRAPAHHHKHHHRADGAGDDDWPQLGAQQIPVLHHADADGHEQ